MTTHRITGGGGIQLHLVEAGNKSGRPILFLHGFSQSSLAWRRQMDSFLADRYRLIAMDLRGHGSSDKPATGYDDSRLWADDVHSAIQTLGLEGAVLCGWSYGPLVMLDYIRHYGDDGIGGMCFVGGITELGTEKAAAVLTPEFLSLVPGFFATDVESSVASLRSLLELCIQDASQEELNTMLDASISVPPHVRRGLLSRCFTNDDLLPKIRRPVLIVHAANDAAVKPDAAEQHKAGFRNAQVAMPPAAGHAVFWNDPVWFNLQLDEFMKSLATGRAAEA